MDPSATDVMAQLKHATAGEHDRIEQHAFQRRLLLGALSRSDYVAYLGQMYLIHRRLEHHLSRAVHPKVTAVVRSSQFQGGNLQADLQYFGVDCDLIAALPAVQMLVRQIERDAAEDLRLLGYHYVLEGSKNGSKYISPRINAALELDQGLGQRYLDPHGDQQQQMWQQFKKDMIDQAFRDPEIIALVEAAIWMFQALYRVSDGLQSMASTGVDSSPQRIGLPDPVP